MGWGQFFKNVAITLVIGGIVASGVGGAALVTGAVMAKTAALMAVYLGASGVVAGTAGLIINNSYNQKSSSNQQSPQIKLTDQQRKQAEKLAKLIQLQFSKAQKQNQEKVKLIQQKYKKLRANYNKKQVKQSLIDQQIQIVQQLYDEQYQQLYTKMVYPEKNVIFIGNTSSGKSSLLNKLFGYDLPTGKGETTKQFSCIHKINKKINVYDSVGYNDQSSDDLEQYRQQINQINYCKIVFVCFEGSLKSLKALVEIICRSRNRMYKVAFIYTKCDLIDQKETPIAQCIAQQRRYLAKIGALSADKYPFFASSKLGGFDNQKIKQLINQQYKE